MDRELGRGGMAVVYLAHDLRHDRKVALKVLHRELAAALGPGRFQREIQLTSRLDHPNILPVFDSGVAGDRLWYSMAYVDGGSLRARLQSEAQLGIPEAIRIAREVAAALEHAHQRGVVHRDIKPENILLSGSRVLVADFGIAKLVGGDAAKLTETGLSLGTPSYMSPEQAAGDARLDGRADVYALGCVLYEMLVGQPPFTGPTAQSVIARHLMDPVPSLRTVRSSVSPGLEAAITTALAKVPADRFATAGAFSDALVAGPSTDRTAPPVDSFGARAVDSPPSLGERRSTPRHRIRRSRLGALSSRWSGHRPGGIRDGRPAVHPRGGGHRCSRVSAAIWLQRSAPTSTAWATSGWWTA